MSIAKELGLVTPRYRRPWTIYVHGLGLYDRFESKEAGEKALGEIRDMSKGMWTTFGPVYEPDTEVYDLTFGALRKDAPAADRRKVIIL